MSEHVTLTLRSSLDAPLDLDGVLPETISTLSELEIANLVIWQGRSRTRLGDWFTVDGEYAQSIRIDGDVRHCRGVGARMSTGSLEIIGDAGDDLGAAMRGGSILVRGNAGDRVGAGLPGASRGMMGGEIIVDGAVGNDAGARMRRGLLFVHGNAGANAAVNIIAGSVVVMGRVGDASGAGSKRGTLVVGGRVDIAATYRFACRYRPPHVRLTLMHLARRYGLVFDAATLDAMYDRFCGDAGTIAKGEILRRVPA